MLDPHLRQQLLTIARESITAKVHAGSPPALADAPPVASPGAFVTLRLDGALRGCIGHLEPTGSLGQTIQRIAMAAATEDPRFPPLSRDELASVVIEISVLGALEPCREPAELEVGRHGVLVDDGARRGLLLPQVAVEWGWDNQTLLAQACLKAGLDPTAWQQGDAQIFRFEAEVFEEQRP